MRRPVQPALTDTATGRVSMPFLPTLFVVAILGVASLYCPTSTPPVPVPAAARSAPVALAPAPSPTDFAPSVALAVPARLPASLAFADVYPLDAVAKPGTPPARPAVAARATSHLAGVSRRVCPNHRCPEMPQRGPDPLAAAHAEAAEPAEDTLLPQQALPFAASVVESLAPTARAVGDAAELLRSGASAVQGSVALAVADCLR